MTRSGAPARKPSQLSPTLQHKLEAYGLGAIAVGVATLAMTQPTQAEIIYTPTSQPIGNNQKVSLDLNNDGVTDFILVNDTHFSTTPFGDDLSILPAVIGNAAGGKMIRRGYFAGAIPAGVSVGSSRKFLARRANLAYASLTAFTYVSGGYWKYARNRYLGLKFLIDGEVHFGWARLNVQANKKTQEVKAILTGYAYETIANQPIVTGQTQDSTALQNQGASDADLSASSRSLGSLAMGAAGQP